MSFVSVFLNVEISTISKIDKLKKYLLYILFIKYFFRLGNFDNFSGLIIVVLHNSNNSIFYSLSLSNSAFIFKLLSLIIFYIIFSKWLLSNLIGFKYFESMINFFKFFKVNALSLEEKGIFLSDIIKYIIKSFK